MFKNVVNTARQSNADYVAYRPGIAKTMCIIDVATEEVVANTSFAGCDIFAAGVAARKQSFLDYRTGQFACGTVEQVAGGAFPIEER